MNLYHDLNPVLGAFVAASINWGMTALGAAFVFVRRDMSKRLLDTMLGFAAGVMIFVTVEEVIPESQSSGNSDLATLGAMLGFTVMMVLDVGLA